MDDKTKTISIIMPAYNAEKYISECITSIINQSYGYWELIIVDDGSSDNTFYICKRYQTIDCRIKAYSKDNEGVSAARNYGIKKSIGDYLCFVDADDLLDIRYLEILHKSMIETNSDLSICSYTSNYFCFQKKEKSCEITEMNPIEFVDELLFKLDKGGFVWNKMFKRDFIHNTMFDSNLHMNEDQLFVLEYTNKINKIVYSSAILYYYRVHVNSTVNKNWNKRRLSVFDAYVSILNCCINSNIPDSIIEKYATNKMEYISSNFYEIVSLLDNKSEIRNKLFECYRFFNQYGTIHFSGLRKFVKSTVFFFFYFFNKIMLLEKKE